MRSATLSIPALVALFLVSAILPSLSPRTSGFETIDAAAASPTTPAPATSAPAIPRDFDRNTRINVNLLDMWVTNYGFFANDVEYADSGLIYPKGSFKRAMYSAGLWMGAMVDDELRVTVAEYSSDYGPGPVLPDGTWADPLDPAYRVYKIERGDTPASNVDYAVWPADDGAPTHPNGDPRVFGDQTLWSVWNDLDPGRHNNGASSTPPLGVEVQHTTFGVEEAGVPGTNMVFLEWKILNKGGQHLEDAYVSLWADPDLGDAADDLVGCEPLESLGYCYNATNDDETYGAAPPAVGLKLIQGPLVPSPGDIGHQGAEEVADHRNLEMSAFSKYINGTDPNSAQESFHYMQGLEADGSPVIDPTTGEETTFAVPGDPVAGTGWVDTDAADRRFMISAGPFDMEPGDTQIIVAAVVMGQGADRLTSISAMRFNAAHAEPFYYSAVANAPGACCVADGCIIVPAAECTGHFTGGACVPDPCPESVGACCLGDGTCEVVAQIDCDGTFMGGGVVCAPDLCPVVGPRWACCLPDRFCESLTEIECLNEGGRYFEGEVCDLGPPQNDTGWRRNDEGSIMMDEVANGGGAVLPDGLGGPGHSLWHRLDSTGSWAISVGGGDGGEDRFTRSGADTENLTYENLELRWDLSPDNFGWWAFEDNSAASVPFGLYAVDAKTGEGRRLIPILFSNLGTEGAFEMSPDTPDGYFDWPATDWIYAYDGDYPSFQLDAMDGVIDDGSVATVEYFARMVFASPVDALPDVGTVIRFSTRNSGLVAGNGFDERVPLSWPISTSGSANCYPPQYEVFRDGRRVGSSSKNHFIDAYDLTPNQPVSYAVRIFNYATSEVTDFTVDVEATPGASGFTLDSSFAPRPPVIDGVLHAKEWAAATEVDATSALDGPAARLHIMNDRDYLYLGLFDGHSVSDVRVHVDPEGDAVYSSPSDGRIFASPTAPGFQVLKGSYPFTSEGRTVESPKWLLTRSADRSLEIRLDLHRGPLAAREEGEPAAIWIYSASGAGQYPVGPAPAMERAPELFAKLFLAGGDVDEAAMESSLAAEAAAGSVSRLLNGRPLPQVATTQSFPNPLIDAATVVFRLPGDDAVGVSIYDVQGRHVRTLLEGARLSTGLHGVNWDGRDEAGRRVASGMYYYEVRGDALAYSRRILVVR